jgi:hypothetical protein
VGLYQLGAERHDATSRATVYRAPRRTAHRPLSLVQLWLEM